MKYICTYMHIYTLYILNYVYILYAICAFIYMHIYAYIMYVQKYICYVYIKCMVHTILHRYYFIYNILCTKSCIISMLLKIVE